MDAFFAICRKWDVQARVVGEVSADDRLIICWRGEVIVDVDPRTVAHQGPVYERPYARPDWQDRVQRAGVDDLERPRDGDALAQTLLRVVSAAEPV